MIEPARMRKQLADVAPTLWHELSMLTEKWLRPVISRLNTCITSQGFPKTFNDPIWGVIELFPWEVSLLDSPMLQRLRGVRQLGFAHYVYPGACHDRLEHSLGVVQAAELMIRTLSRNADHRRKFGDAPDALVPEPSEMDIHSTRLAALLHDIGHGPFSHVTEPLIRDRFLFEFQEVENVIRNTFEGVTQISTSETVAVVFIMSDHMRAVFEHPKFTRVGPANQLPLAIAARMVGSRSLLQAAYLSGIISGPLDADKLDYMARDSHHAGLPLGLDIKRLISKLEVVTVTPDNAPDFKMRDRALALPNKRFYEIGISLSGLGAYEQMIISRVILYDRIYYHHKVRATEAMARRLITLSEEEGGRPYTFSELFQAASDDSLIRILSGAMKSKQESLGGVRATAMGEALLERRIYYRAYAFAARFIDGLDGLPEVEQKDTRAILWNTVLKALGNLKQCENFALEIYKKACLIMELITDFYEKCRELKPEHIIIDLAPNKVTVPGSDILTRTESGHVEPPSLIFNTERWSQAYEHQKQCGFVFTPIEYVPLIMLSSRIMFYEKFQLVMKPIAEHISKTVRVVKPDWIHQVAERGICTAECVEALTESKPMLVPIREDELLLPDSWRTNDTSLAKRLADGFRDTLPAGLPASVHQGVIEAIKNLALFLDMIDKSGKFVGVKKLKEKELQDCIRDHFRSIGVEIQEGTEVGGGETDLVLPGPLIIENKVRQEPTFAPLGSGCHYVWQARRYSIAICSSVMFVVVAYRPANEAVILPLTQRIVVTSPDESPEGYAQVRIVIPWGHSRPSKARVVKKHKQIGS